MSNLLKTARIAGRTMTVLTRPFTLAEAFEGMRSDGHVGAIVKVKVEDFVGPEISYDAFFDGLIEALVDGYMPAYSVSYEVLGIADGGKDMYVSVNQNIASMIECEGEGADFLSGVSPAIIAAAMDRLSA